MSLDVASEIPRLGLSRMIGSFNSWREAYVIADAEPYIQSGLTVHITV